MQWTTLGAPSIAWTRHLPRSRRRVGPVEPGDGPAPSSMERDPRSVPPAVARNEAPAPVRPHHVDRI